ncbi:MAG: 3-isopropylmalate dehydrogenase, partial [Deltaproteobacteria bacterium]|nr:3-isopropylmalate dehydrogenase [Deltaproteobacteria bacterium]
MNYKIAVLPGDGIGPEVVREGSQVLTQVASLYGFLVEYEGGIVGGASIDAYGKPLTDPVLKLAKQSDAVLLGAMGGPKWDGLDYSIRPERALLALRQELGLFANLRPVKLFSALASASTLRREVVEGTDLLVVRELIGGIYFGQPKGVTKLPDGTERGVN